MKLQYLGDSRDSFKWHYHDYLVNNNSNAGSLGVIPMLRPNNGTTEGGTNSYDYNGSSETQDFCHLLRMNRDISDIRLLPKYTGSNYQLIVHKPLEYYFHQSSKEYFEGIPCTNICLLDPCTGFEPKNPNDNHVQYEDIAYFINTLPKRGVFSIYQHFRRKKFTEDFKAISKNLAENSHPFCLNSCAIFWRSDVMFVQTSKSKDEIRLIHEINIEYASNNKDVVAIDPNYQ